MRPRSRSPHIHLEDLDPARMQRLRAILDEILELPTHEAERILDRLIGAAAKAARGGALYFMH